MFKFKLKTHCVIILVNDEFYYTGSSQYVVVPPGRNIMTITAYGSAGLGFNFYYSDYSGGLGGSITARFSVIPGETYLVCVGGSGGNFDGGSVSYGGNGGGSTDIFLVGNCSRILVAGAGGGAGCDSSGGDGGLMSNIGDTPQSAGAGGDCSGGGGGGYVGGGGGEYSTGGSGGTSYTSGFLINSEVGVKSGAGHVLVAFSSHGVVQGSVPKPDKLCLFTPQCYFAPPTPQPTGIAIYILRNSKSHRRSR